MRSQRKRLVQLLQLRNGTEAIDAFQRANFWQVLGGSGNGYHVLLSPVIVLDPIVVDGTQAGWP
jgi:hypothetical protein